MKETLVDLWYKAIALYLILFACGVLYLIYLYPNILSIPLAMAFCFIATVFIYYAGAILISLILDFYCYCKKVITSI